VIALARPIITQDVEGPPPSRERWHGTADGYNNHGCRGEDCRSAWAKYVFARRSERGAREAPERVHGTVNGYLNYACRCDRCKAAKAAARRASKGGK